MNSNWVVNLPKPPMEYDQAYFNRLVQALEETLQRARARGLIEVQNINVSSLPTASTGLRSGDLWSDAGTIKVIP